MDEFWSVLAVELDRHGAKTQLAEYLGCHAKLLYDWRTGRKVPGQETVTAMGRWLRSQLKTG
jgi:hypothetical protein